MLSSLSVVIPTFNRCGTLQKVLSAYLHQSVITQIAEILVVDDGSSDSTSAVVDYIANLSSVSVKYFRQCNKGPAAARNIGIREASSELILFTDDDIIPTPTLVAEHLDWHRRFPEESTAVMGSVTWDPDLKPTPFMKWYGAYGALFSYAYFKGLTQLDYKYFYTCNISLKTKFLRVNGTFDEEFKSAAYEDAELAFRLNKAGLSLLYNSQALAYHHQFFLFSDACRKALANTKATELFLQKEAGQSVLLEQRKRRSRLRVRIVRQAMTAAAIALKPVRSLLNSYVPLPRLIYRLFFWYDVTRTVDLFKSRNLNDQ